MNKTKMRGHIGYFINKTCLKMIDRNSAALYHIIKNWKRIVGEDFFKIAIPIKVSKVNNSFILTVGVIHPSITLEIQAKENTILESIAQILGYRMIRKLKFKHSVIIKRKRTLSLNNEENYKHKLCKENIEEINKQFQKLKKSELLDILKSLQQNCFD